MESQQPSVIRENLNTLISKTKNVEALAEQLEEYDVLSASEVKHIVNKHPLCSTFSRKSCKRLRCKNLKYYVCNLQKTCSDEPSSCHLLYELIAPKLPSAFNLLIFALRDTDNDQVSQLLETLVDNASLDVIPFKSSYLYIPT